MDRPHFNTVLINIRSSTSALAGAVADRLCVLPCVRLSIHSHYNEETYRKKCLTPHVFAYIYKLLYAYVYPYNHKNVLLGCTGRGLTHWYRFESPRTFGIHEKLEVFQNSPLSLYFPHSSYYFIQRSFHQSNFHLSNFLYINPVFTEQITSI